MNGVRIMHAVLSKKSSDEYHNLNRTLQDQIIRNQGTDNLCRFLLDVSVFQNTRYIKPHRMVLMICRTPYFGTVLELCVNSFGTTLIRHDRYIPIAVALL